jgi:AraC-like DNA-binding protein
VLRLAERSGYKSYSTFSAAFKRITGLSETDWMKQCKK